MPKEPPKSWQELGDEFHMHIGYCVAAWARIEDELFRICRACLKCPAEQVAIVYYRTPTIDARIQLLDELLSTVFPKPARISGGHRHEAIKRWEKISGKLTELLRMRNRLAHHPVAVRTTYSVPSSTGETQAAEHSFEFT